MVSNDRIRKMCEAHQLGIMSVTWEDTGRYKGSSVGPNISDMTLTVGNENLPVIRMPNFSDVTADLPIDKFFVTVGNEVKETKDGKVRTLCVFFGSHLWLFCQARDATYSVSRVFGKNCPLHGQR